MASVNARQSWIAVLAVALGGTALFISLSRNNDNVAFAQPASGADFSHLQFSGVIGGFFIFDSKTGNVFVYEKGGQQPRFVGRMTEPGKPLAPDQAK